jgi:alpha-amylase
MSIRKGSMTVLITNAGSNGKSATLNLDGYSARTDVVDVVGCTTLTSSRTGILSVTVAKGMPMVFYPKSSLSGSGICKL